MSLNAVAHLNFHGQARAALEFYQSVFGGQATIVTYGDFGMSADLPDAGKVVFGQVTAGNGFRVMAYDVPGTDGPAAPAEPTTRRENGTTITREPFFLSIRGETVDEVAAVWERLADGATVIEAFGPAQWAPAFGMLADRFGVTWILDVATEYAPA
ncbi:PhnB protein [Amycolatopsis bartoniae]|uniref:VOC family protein n=1 Tax=Amycolatopsis bartoniae TaxID=941986 RepID=A0A8H9J3Q4_9PSEU|nr:VOC family protein [Amycolatopsis bartoniae]MBB2938539.1 PhnB protein [Amycolatopsis bartoniae]TVT10320.1 VOC family protein [Amycolatopsis bartoniae]GHF70283.1 VOC family protein [Amycolatopsis bartoniae]